MAESKFTPGPWAAEKVTASKIAYWSIHTKDQFIGRTGHLGISLEEQKANAELMADAPRLLEVLRKVLTYSEPLLGWQHIDEAERAFTEAHELLEKHGG